MNAIFAILPQELPEHIKCKSEGERGNGSMCCNEGQGDLGMLLEIEL